MGLPENILKSLDKEEIRCLRKTIFTDRNAQSSKLFELMLEHGQDEDKIAARFRRIAPKGNLAVVRHQLLQLMLDGVRTMHMHEYPSAEIDAAITQAQIFIDKSALEVAKKLIDKALEKARACEMFSQMIRLLEMKLYIKQSSQGLVSEDVKAILAEFTETVARQYNYHRYTSLWQEIRVLTNDAYLIRDEKTKALWERLYADPLLADPSQALSIRALSRYWIVKSGYYLTDINYPQARYCYEELVKLCEEHEFIKRQNSINYFWALSKLAHIGYYLKDTNLMHRSLEAIGNHKKWGLAQEAAAFTFNATYRMAYYDLLNDKQAKLKMADDSYQNLKPLIERVKPHAVIGMLVTCVSVWIEAGHYEKCLTAMREYHRFINAEHKLDALIVLLFYELIAQIETGNELMVNDTLQNFNRFMLRNNFKREFEQLMVRFLKIISSYRPDMKEELAELKSQLLKLPDRSYLDQHPVLNQVLITMIDSRLAGMKYHLYMNSETAT